MPLTDAKCEKLVPKADGTLRKELDFNRLYLIARVSRGETRKTWHWYYLRPGTNKETSITLGVYGNHPGELDLDAARAKRKQCEDMVKAGTDPAHPDDVTKVDGGARLPFRARAAQWFAAEQTGVMRPRTIHRNLSLVNHLNTHLGDRWFDEIIADDIHAAYNAIKTKVSAETARRCINRASEIFTFGKNQKPQPWCKADPARDVADWIIAENEKRARRTGGTKEEKRPSIVRTGVLPQWLTRLATLVKRIDGYDMRKESGPFAKLALQFLLLTGVRPGMVCDAEWKEIDFDLKLWTVPAAKMKMGEDFVMPLSRQAMAILKRLRPLTDLDGNRWIFSPRTTYIKLKTHKADGTEGIEKIPCGMSHGTINAALQLMGYDTKTELCGHGFRAISITLLKENELWAAPWSRDTIKHHHAHRASEGAQARYDESQNHSERVKLAQAWADFLDTHHEKPKLRLVG